jgi:2-isopropylmalate synthase
VPNSDKAVWSVIATTISASRSRISLRLGDARRAPSQCTINGSASAPATSARGNRDGGEGARTCFQCTTRIDTTQILAASKLVSGVTGFPVQPNKAIVGANAFSHESGIHQDGVLKHRETYEIMRAEDVGWNANKLSLGKLSGRNAFKTKLTELGIDLGTDEALNNAFARFKELADKKGQVFDEDLHALVSDETVTPEHEHYRLITLKVVSRTAEHGPSARSRDGRQNTTLHAETGGDGPGRRGVQGDRTHGVVERERCCCTRSSTITMGTDAQGEVTVRRSSRNGRIVNETVRIPTSSSRPRGVSQRAQQAARQAGAAGAPNGGGVGTMGAGEQATPAGKSQDRRRRRRRVARRPADRTAVGAAGSGHTSTTTRYHGDLAATILEMGAIRPIGCGSSRAVAE